MLRLLLITTILFSYSCTSNKNDVYIQKWVVVGNSITWHPVNDNWYGEWGMAATSLENDYVHLLNNKFKSNCDSVSFKIAWAVDWETNHTHFDLSYFDNYFNGKEDLVIVRLGENVRDITNYETDFLNLIKYFKKLSPKAQIVITGIFMSETNDLVFKEDVQKRISDFEGCIWVPINNLDTEKNRNYIGNYVNGHKIENQTVANHPGDNGMKAIANAIYDAIN